MPNFGRNTECEVINESLPRHHDGKFGYVVYRCVYGNDEEWTQFIERLKQYADHALGRVADGNLIKSNLTFDVQEDQAELDGASKTKVREHFRAWSTSVNGERTLTRYTKCIYADAEVIKSVLEGEDPASTAREDRRSPQAIVTIVNSDYRDEIKPIDPGYFEDSEEERRYNEGDDGYPAIEGCKRQDVGWMRVPARRLVPRAYEGMMKNGWYIFYKRPPAVFDD